jgi:hypothetical protein
VKVTTHLYLVPSSRMRGTIRPLPNTPSWRGDQLIVHVKHVMNGSETSSVRIRSREATCV